MGASQSENKHNNNNSEVFGTTSLVNDGNGEIRTVRMIYVPSTGTKTTRNRKGFLWHDR